MLVEPFVGVDKIKFGMTRDQVHTVAEGTLTIQGDSDFYLDKNYAVHYEGNRVAAVEAFSPEPLEIVNFNFCGKPFSSVKKWLQEHDEHADITPPDIRSDKFGIAMYIPDALVETALAFQRGYFNGSVSDVPSTSEGG